MPRRLPSPRPLDDVDARVTVEDVHGDHARFGDEMIHELDPDRLRVVRVPAVQRALAQSSGGVG